MVYLLIFHSTRLVPQGHFGQNGFRMNLVKEGAAGGNWDLGFPLPIRGIRDCDHLDCTSIYFRNSLSARLPSSRLRLAG